MSDMRRLKILCRKLRVPSKITLTILGSLILGLVVPSFAGAADIFVMNASGTEPGAQLTQQQSGEVTEMVKRAVRRMPEHTLVSTENQADFVLRPSVMNRNDELVLRIEKLLDGDVLSMAEEPIGSVQASADQALAATETAMMEDRIATSENVVDEASGEDEGRDESRDDRRDATTSATTMDGDNETAKQPASGDVRAPSPVMARADRIGTFQIGVGPAFGIGLNSDELLYNINAGYIMPFNERFAGKAFGDLNLSAGSEAARFINIGVGAEAYPALGQVAGGIPYIQGDLGFAFARDGDERITDAPAVGAGAGFKFAARETNLDINAHYTFLTAKIDDNYPSVFGIRAALNF